MYLVGLFIPTSTDHWHQIHCQTTNSDTDDLKRRLATFACDLYVFEHSLQHQGHAITDSSCLWSLVGKLYSVRPTTLYCICII